MAKIQIKVSFEFDLILKLIEKSQLKKSSSDNSDIDESLGNEHKQTEEAVNFIFL